MYKKGKLIQQLVVYTNFRHSQVEKSSTFSDSNNQCSASLCYTSKSLKQFQTLLDLPHFNVVSRAKSKQEMIKKSMGEKEKCFAGESWSTCAVK